MSKNENAETKTETKAEVRVNPEASSTGGTTPPQPTELSVPSTAPRLKEEDEVVEVSKLDLKNFMKRMEDLEESNRKLLAVADKGRMFQITEAERKTQVSVPTVKLTRMGSSRGKLVIAWKMGKNESYVDGNRLVEHQTINLFYQDGTSEEIALLDFYRQQNKETVGKIKARTRNEDGSETLKVELVTGELVEVALKFVN